MRFPHVAPKLMQRPPDEVLFDGLTIEFPQQDRDAREGVGFGFGGAVIPDVPAHIIEYRLDGIKRRVVVIGSGEGVQAPAQHIVKGQRLRRREQKAQGAKRGLDVRPVFQAPPRRRLSNAAVFPEYRHASVSDLADDLLEVDDRPHRDGDCVHKIIPFGLAYQSHDQEAVLAPGR